MNRMARMGADAVWRDEAAASILGHVYGKTSGMMSEDHRHVDGWIYVGATAVLFIADEPVFAGAERSADGRCYPVLYEEVPNLVFSYPRIGYLARVADTDRGGELRGRKDDIRVLEGMHAMWPRLREQLARDAQTADPDQAD
jgi:hypothetical protein